MRDLLIWLGDHLPDPLGSWMLRTFSPLEEEPWTDAEGRIVRPEDRPTRE